MASNRTIRNKIISMKEQDLQKEIIRQIKDSRWSVKGYFHDLFKQLMPEELLNMDRMTVVDAFITQETLPETLAKNYEKDGYVLLFYAHRTHTGLISPFNGDTNASHTSLLLCKVEDGKINQVLNIDGYHNLGYMDIIGERPGGTPNPHIKNRLIIDAPDVDNPKQRKPLQSASWNNLNCPLYAFAFVKAILKTFEVAPEVLDELFAGKSISQPALSDLKEMILQGVIGTYVKYESGACYRDSAAGMEFHDNVRETLAKTVQARFDRQQDIISLEEKSVIMPKEEKEATVQHTSVTYSSLFKPVTNEPSKAVAKLMKLCSTYQSHLYDDLQKMTKKKPGELAAFVHTHVINKTVPTDLDKLVKKCKIVNAMMDALQNSAEPDETTRIKNMSTILTQENKATLAEHRSMGGKFLQAVLNVLSALASLVSRKDLRYKTKGEQLCDKIKMETSGQMAV